MSYVFCTKLAEYFFFNAQLLGILYKIALPELHILWKEARPLPQVHKRFPADTTSEEITFLNDGKIEAQLYAYLQSLSYPDPETKQTRVDKARLPKQEVIAEEILRTKSRNTVGNHLKYLKEAGFIIDEGKYYILPDREKMFFKMPLELLNYFIDTIKEPVLKTYIYLGQRYSYKPHDYVFTIQEIAEHIGMNYNKQSKVVSNYVDILERLDLIKVAHYYEGKTPRMKLINFNTTLPNKK